MDLDFLLTTIIYLVVILSTHFYLKSYDPVVSNSDDKMIHNLKNTSPVTDDQENDEPEYSNDTEMDVREQEEDNLVIKENELDNMNNTETSADFMKYLDVEDYDKTETYKSLVKTIKEKDNTTSVLENSLNKYFENIKESNDEFTFDPVPTKNEIDYNDKGLLKDIKKLNDDNIYDNVNAFDDFNSTYAPV